MLQDCVRKGKNTEMHAHEAYSVKRLLSIAATRKTKQARQYGMPHTAYAWQQNNTRRYMSSILTIIEDNQQRRQQVTHSLNVTNILVLPHVTTATKKIWKRIVKDRQVSPIKIERPVRKYWIPWPCLEKRNGYHETEVIANSFDSLHKHMCVLETVHIQTTQKLCPNTEKRFLTPADQLSTTSKWFILTT